MQKTNQKKKKKKKHGDLECHAQVHIPQALVHFVFTALPLTTVAEDNCKNILCIAKDN